MPKRSAEDVVRELMREHESIYGPVAPPVPVDKIAADTLEYMVAGAADPRTKMKRGPIPGNVISALLLFDERRVWLRAADHQHRQRFSLAHEIGHDQLHCRGQQSPGDKVFACGDEEIVEARFADQTVEREANAFAAELLLPTHLLEPKVSRHDAQMSLVLDLAREFEVSPVCMAIRIARAAWQPYAMIVSSNETVDFSFCSKAMREFSSYGFIEKGAALDKGAETAKYFRSRGHCRQLLPGAGERGTRSAERGTGNGERGAGRARRQGARMPELNGKPRRLPTTGNRQPATAFDALRVLARRSLAVGTYGGLCCNTPGCPHPGDKRPAERCPHADECAAEIKWLRELAGTDSPQMHADERGGS